MDAACYNQPKNHTILTERRVIELENCGLEVTNADIKSFLQDQAGLGNSEICADSCKDEAGSRPISLMYLLPNVKNDSINVFS